MRLNHLKALKEGKTMDNMPIVTLKSGLRVGNFSSPHPFAFVTGEVLTACSPERARGLMLDVSEEEAVHSLGFTDIRLKFSMSAEVARALGEIDPSTVDVILVPLPVQQAINACNESVSPQGVKWNHLLGRTRVCRVADRVTKTIYGDRFCL